MNNRLGTFRGDNNHVPSIRPMTRQGNNKNTLIINTGRVRTWDVFTGEIMDPHTNILGDVGQDIIDYIDSPGDDETFSGVLQRLEEMQGNGFMMEKSMKHCKNGVKNMKTNGEQLKATGVEGGSDPQPLAQAGRGLPEALITTISCAL